MIKKNVEEVFVTEGVPQYTFIPPPNFNEIFLDVRRSGKPVIIEGQSGTGKTTCIKKILERLPETQAARYLTARNASDVAEIIVLAKAPRRGIFVIDDLHRLDSCLQTDLADIAKTAAEQADPNDQLPKLILIGINEVGSTLIQLVPDIAKRCGIHRINPGTDIEIRELINRGSLELGIEIHSAETVYAESRGDYWLTQQLCQTICTMNNVLETCEIRKVLRFDQKALRAKVVERLKAAYYPAVKEFCRGKRFRPSNDPYFKLLRTISLQASSIVDINALSNSTPDVRGSINNIKDRRLGILLQSKPACARLFYYNGETKYFAIEDPALFYFLQHLDWEVLRIDCGFKEGAKDYHFDFAISFAGENRELARHLASQLEILDASVFFDENYEVNFLGKAWGEEFRRIFSEDSRLVVCLLDKNHSAKIWPTFERECFTSRVSDGDVIPIYLDNTTFVGMPKDTVGFMFKAKLGSPEWEKEADEIVYKLIDNVANHLNV